MKQKYFPLTLICKASLLCLDDMRKVFSTDGRRGKKKSDPASQMRTALNPQGDGAAAFVTAEGDCGDPLSECWQHIID